MGTTTYRNGYDSGSYLDDGSYLHGDASYGDGFQVKMIVQTTDARAMQAEMILVSLEDEQGQQAEMRVADAQELGQQTMMQIVDHLATVGGQADMFATDRDGFAGIQAFHDKLRHALLGVYLSGGYLEDPYLTEQMGAFMGMQARMLIEDRTLTPGMQAQRIILKQLVLGHQVEMVVEKTRTRGMQVSRITVDRLGAQVTMVVYNTTQLRMMWLFPSQGTEALGGDNWTSTSTASGDFSPNNVNTDVEEQVFRSADGDTEITITCNTGLDQGVPVDTVAIRSHNLTRSALVQMQGSNDAGFGTINKVYDIPVELVHTYFISDTFPTSLAQNKFWRFIIQDPSNPDGYIQIGAIRFGAARIFSSSESFENPIVRGTRHFKDSMQTEGFTAVSNDRAIKRYIKLSFKDIDFFKGNWRLIDEMLDYARTSLKVLVIPTPTNASRFAVYGKLAAMPETTHTSDDDGGDDGRGQELIDFTLEFDESL